MQIVNDKIKIAQGETSTYSVEVINRVGNEGIPYRLYGDKTYYAVFTVVPDVYKNKTDRKISKYIPLDNKIRFQSSEIKDATSTQQPTGVVENTLYRVTLPNQTPKYYVKPTGGAWGEYKFDITFEFDYKDTSKLEPKTYKYDLTIGAGDITAEGVFDEDTITYFEPLIKYEDFTVEVVTHE